MAFIIKTLLSTSSTQYYYNTQEEENTYRTYATNIRFTNISGSAATVFLSFYNDSLSETFEIGAVVYGLSIPANESIEIQDRYLGENDKIFAYSGTADVIAMSIDIIGLDGRYEPTPP